MRDDLLDAYAAVDWAIAHLEAFERRLNEWIRRPAYSFIEEDRPEIGKKLIKLQLDERIGDSLINADVGAIINSARSSLDILTANLARRNGRTPNEDCHFPIYQTVVDFIDPLAEAKRKKWFRDAERAILESLKPYRGGDDLLFALHYLDIERKHKRLIRIAPAISEIVLPPAAYAQGFNFVAAWPGFYDGAVVATAPINATNHEFKITLEITLDEPELLPSDPIVAILRQLTRRAASIIELFETS